MVESENDKKSRLSVIKEYEERIRNIQEELTQQRGELLTLVEQKHELLESKIGVEKYEVGRELELYIDFVSLNRSNSGRIFSLDDQLWLAGLIRRRFHRSCFRFGSTHMKMIWEPRCRHTEGCDPASLDRSTLPLTEVEDE